MKLIIANDLDSWIARKNDIRAWAHRLLWFVESGDVVVMMSDPDMDFVNYLCELKGIDYRTLKFFIPPNNRHEGKIFDHVALLDKDFIAKISTEISGVREVVAAWPSPQVADFVHLIGLSDKWPGCRLFSQGACELLNSMGSFRAFAAAANVPISQGTVCRSKEIAIYSTRSLLSVSRALVVKKAHGGAGAGNHIITMKTDLAAYSSGGKYLTVLENLDSAIDDFWNDRWEWASASNAYPVVIEEFQENARSIYAEYECAEQRISLGAIGELIFADRSLTRETVPVTELGNDVRENLEKLSSKLADYYWSLGYRGPLSADAVVKKTGEIYFTEVNAQYTGSTHLYKVIGSLWGGSDHQVTQITSPSKWPNLSTVEYISRLRNSRTLRENENGSGVIILTPHIGSLPEGPIVLGLIHRGSVDLELLLFELDSIFCESRL